MDLGTKIKVLRVANNYTQEALGEELFVSSKTVSSWENNRTTPDLNTLFRIANIFNVSFYELVYDNYTNKEDIELELKLKVGELDYIRVLNFMKNNAEYIDEEEHNATYFEPVFRKFNHEYLRIRSENGKNVLNYKKDLKEFGCTEYETLVDNKNELAKILEVLGYNKFLEINKTRTKFLYKNVYEVSFDKLEGIGLFIEFEVKKVMDDKIHEYEKLMAILNELNLDIKLIDNRHYPDILGE